MLAQDIDRYVGAQEIVHHYPSSNEISLTGKQIIGEYMATEGLPALPQDWVWQYRVTDGEYTGKFSKRVGKYVHQATGGKLTDAQRAWVGKVAREHQADSKPMYFDITDTFDWRDGDFADGGSCFWGDNRGAKTAMEDDEDFYAIRFYSEQQAGVGRAWLHVVDEQCIVIFNAYGPYETLEIAHLLAQRQGSEYIYKQIELANFGQDTGMLYINGCGKGYAVCEKTHWLCDQGSYDFELDVPHECHCAMCGCGVYEEDTSYVEGYDGVICSDCFDNHFFHCSSCGDAYNDAEARYIEIPGQRHQKTVCSYCFGGDYFECTICDCNYSKEHLAWEDDDTAMICSVCYDDLDTCAMCDTPMHEQNPNSDHLCDNCFDGKFIACSKCSCAIPLETFTPYQREQVEVSPAKILCKECTRAKYGYAQLPLFQQEHVTKNWVYSDDVETGACHVMSSGLNAKCVQVNL